MTTKKLKNIEKSRAEELKMPIMVYPVLLLDIETPKKKKVTVIGIGSRNNSWQFEFHRFQSLPLIWVIEILSVFLLAL